MSKYPIFSWLKERSSGFLLHPTSLPGDQGIGVLGPDAYLLIDFAREAGMKYWQVCPLGPTGYGDSPYQCFSAFAGNPYLIDLKALVSFGLLEKTDLEPMRELPNLRIDFGGLFSRKWPILRLAYKRFLEKGKADLPDYEIFEDFQAENAGWLNSYAFFMTLKNHFGGKSWLDWPDPYRSIGGAYSAPLARQLSEEIEFQKFTQYLFFGQWGLIRKYASENNLGIIGDIPIFVALDSADVWAHSEIFQLNNNGRPNAVAGVPPDYFSPMGQLWGNPLFDWEALAACGYGWWMDRLSANSKLFDVVRLDHFRGFESYWRVPAGAEYARSGEWMNGPGIDFFLAVNKRFPKVELIAEDLGLITPEVRELLRSTGLPGMAVLQFAFSGDHENLYLPHNLACNSVLYPGTHDNDTTKGWYESMPPEIQHQVRLYLSVDGSDISWDFIRTAYSSVSNMAIVTLQDILGHGSGSRMNLPGKASDNWQWRFSRDDFERLFKLAPSLRDLAETNNR